MSIAYRPHIDGLRAIAVLAVIIYHAHISVAEYNILSGGFIGVDVFFVISGYLIGSILIKDLRNKTFTFRNFYERRARRILPSLFTVMIASLPLAWLFMFPTDFQNYAKSIISSVFFGSNIVFWQEGGYSDTANALKPFLHTWSLSVEEQFYIFFPPLLMMIHKYARNQILYLFALGTVLSLALAHWAAYQYTSAAFYLLPTRGWELLAGAIIAIFHQNGSKARISFYTQYMPSLGLGLILWAIIGFDDQVPHPSLWTALPVIGTMSILYYGGVQKDPASWLLSLKPMVWIGLISYSLYLWHQPLFAFARLASIDALSLNIKLGLIALTFILSILSWRYIEQPFRDKNAVSTKLLLIILSVTSAVISVIALCGIYNGGFSDRFHSPLMKHLEPKRFDYIYVDGKKCHERFAKEACVLGKETATQNWVIIGDSHMGQMSTSLWNRLKQDQNKRLTILTRGGCPYAPDIILGRGQQDHPCPPEMNKQRQERLLSMPPSNIIIGGRLPFYISGKRFDNEMGGIEPSQGNFDYKMNLNKNSSHQNVKASLVSSLQELIDHGHHLILIYPTPEFGWNVTEKMRKIIRAKGTKNFNQWLENEGISIPYSLFKKRAQDAYDIYDALGDNEHITRIYPEKIFCSEQTAQCTAHGKDQIYFKDQDHPSLTGYALILNQIMTEMETK